MKKMLTCVLGFVLAGGPAGVAFAAPDTLTIIHVNDTHSNLTPYGGPQYGGIARAASVIGQWKQTEPNPLLIHAGDLMVGTLFFNAYFGVPELQILNNLGFDVLCPGNHEFDPGSDQLCAILTGAGLDTSFKVICSNALNVQAVPGLDAVIHPYAIKQIGSLKVGIVAITTPAANVESKPSPVFIDTNVVQDVMTYVGDLRTAGCQVVILVSHMGLATDTTLAHFLSGVDAIIGGHTHTAMHSAIIVNGIPVVQAGDSYHYAGKLHLMFDGGSTTVLDYTLQEITPAIPAEPSIEALIEGLKQGIAGQYAALLGNPWDTLTHATTYLQYEPESVSALRSPLGIDLTRSMLWYDSASAGPHADFAIDATGHMAADLYAGAVTTADLFRVYPYGYDSRDGLGFRVAWFDLYGAEIQGILEGLLNYIDPATGNWEYVVQTNGLDYTIDNSGGGMSLGPVTVKGAPLDPAQSYRLVSSDQVLGYVQNLFGITPRNVTVDTVAVFKVFFNYMKRFDIISGVRNPFVPAGFELAQNYPNPFNPTTTIQFSLAKSSPVTLRIYNILGEEVETLVSGLQEPGTHSVVWNARSHASGPYFCRLTAGGRTATRSLLLLK